MLRVYHVRHISPWKTRPVADVVILADARLALRDLIAAVRERLGSGSGGVKPEIAAEIQRARTKWLGEWMPIFTDTAAPTNGYRVIYDLMQVIDRDKTIAIHDAGGSRGYMSPFWVASKPLTYIGMGGSIMGMNRPTGSPPAVVQLGGNFSLVEQGLGAYSERVEHPDNLIPVYRRAIRATEEGQAALVEVMIKPMRTPELPDDWSVD